MDVEVRGAADIARVAAEVRRLGNGREIPQRMAKRIRKAVPPIRKGVKASALSTLPSRGGLNRWVAQAGVRASVRRGARNAGVSLVSGRNSRGGRSDLRRINQGRVRHPLYGNRSKWFLQQVPAGYFDRGVEPGVDEFRQQTVEAINEAVREVFG